jgi:class 3 adenylate cyclase
MATRKRRSDGRYESSIRYEKPDGTRGRLPVYGRTNAELERLLHEKRERLLKGAPVRDSSAMLASPSPGRRLFTDVVASTDHLTRVGDAAYRKLRADHERLLRLAVETNGGRVLTVSGDGTLSVFSGPNPAVRCADKIRLQADAAGISIRAGIHTGELHRDGLNVTGLTVHIGARVGPAAAPGEILVSRTVHDLVAGSGLSFASKGEHELKSIPGSWELFAVTHAGEQRNNLPQEDSMQTAMDKMVLQAARNTPGLMRAAVRLGNAIERRRARAG